MFFLPKMAWSALLASIACGAGADAQVNPLYFHSNYPGGSSPRSARLGDFNEDGNLDALVPNWLSSDVSLFLGDGAGGFAPHTTFAVGSAPRKAALADLNGDGHLDAVITNHYSWTISVLIGDGMGGFAPHVDYAVDQNPIGVSLADIDEDGNLDAIVADYEHLRVSTLLGRGDGTFAPQTTWWVGIGPRHALAGDFNEDGHVDIAAVLMKEDRIVILAGDGTGSFTTLNPVPVGKDPTHGAICDLDEDGHQDLIATNWNDNTISVMLGNGDGTFQNQVTYPVGQRPHCVSAGDLNGDGHLDLAVANHDSGTISVLIGDGSGALATTAASIPVGSLPTFVVFGDLDHGGQLEAVVANKGSANISVLWNAAPQITGIQSLAAFESGDLHLIGSGFDANTTAYVQGLPVVVSAFTATTLDLMVGLEDPGWEDLRVANGLGSLALSQVLPRFPALAAGPAVLGGNFTIQLENGSEGSFYIFLALATLPAPVSLQPAIYGHLLLPYLDVPLAIGSIAPGGVEALIQLSLPPDPIYAGVHFYMQGWTTRSTSGAMSFTNMVEFTLIQP